MEKKTLKILSCTLPVSENTQTVYLSANMVEQFNLKERSIYTLICGINSLSVKIKKLYGKNMGSDMLWLSDDIFKKILIPEGIRLEVIFANEIIRIGPILAVLTENKFLKDYLNGTDCVEDYSIYADAAEEAGALIYVFSLKNLDLKGKYINGYMPERDENNKWAWHKHCFPMPDAICNRMAAAASSPAYKKIKLIAEIVPDIKIINKITKISKWEIAKILQRDSSAKEYIPETHLLRGPLDIAGMLEKYPEIYLKPVRRSLGLGIIKMEKNADGSYWAYYFNGDNKRINGDVNAILAELKEIMGKRRYIVQQGIQVAPYEKCPCDFRVTMQKGRTGEWLFVRCVARVAAPGNIVSNVAAGGRGVAAEIILNENFRGRVNQIRENIRKAGTVIAEALDRRIDDLGDLGLDIGIDINGRIYLFEVNFRAMRPVHVNPRDAKAWLLMYHTPVYYLKYLYDAEIEKKYNPQL